MKIIEQEEYQSLGKTTTEEEVMQEELDKFNKVKQSFIDKKSGNSVDTHHKNESSTLTQETSHPKQKADNTTSVQKLSATEIAELERQVEDAIKTIYDPEIPVNIWELGLIYDISITHSREVVVLMTLTAPNCPEAGGIPVEVESTIKEIPGITNCKAILTFEPAWDMNRMSELAKFELGML